MPIIRSQINRKSNLDAFPVSVFTSYLCVWAIDIDHPIVATSGWDSKELEFTVINMACLSARSVLNYN